MNADEREDNSGAQPGSQTVSRAMQILRLVACGQEHGVRLTDIVNISGLNRPTARRILKTLLQEQAVEQDPLTRRYLIGSELTLLGLARRRRFPLLSAAPTCLNYLAQSIGDTAFLSIRHRLDSICIARQTGHHPIQVLSIDVGARRPLGAGVSGVAILSCLSQEELQPIVTANAKRLAQGALTPEQLVQRVQIARDLGYAYVQNGVMSGTSAVAVPVVDAAGHPRAALTITAMSNRLEPSRLSYVVEQMNGQAEQLSRHADLNAN
ncbi:IclR family transcriptional regulator [Advenella mimigardefordensis]|uniref:Transcriptional regulator, IclR family n=1 Tax=Advenella mimigardefordensis (strain DSM 17166 / LMG 22922 / DPN7) TaxID=1247726 RepID=W0PEW6_ADVMD|nr:IclR family transcriptional regulator [Advenella mimigardefordensis]AHG65534.1 transcriptional regulator, IclR family [Advenella mimigardefordensis DPN7]